MCSGIYITIEELDAASTMPPQSDADGHRLHVGKHVESAITFIRVAARTDAHQLWQLVLSADDAPSTVHANMAYCHSPWLFLGIGPHIVCLNTAMGQLRWVQRADSATVFGIHPITGEDAILIHGEMEITKLSLDGIIVWQASGRDIFTGQVVLNGDHIEATDFNGEIYAIQLDTGASTIIGHDEPPH